MNFPDKENNNGSSTGGNIEKVKAILGIIGSPFNNPQNLNLDHFDLTELYDIAKKNKIGFLFLESLAKKKIITERLQYELEKNREIYLTQRLTAERSAFILNKTGCNYAVVKSLYPFPATPNDIDLLILDGNDKYRDAVQSMKNNHFELVGYEAPLEICLHDTRSSNHFDDPKKNFASKDPYDIDIYKEVGASHIIYMNKRKLINKTSIININGTSVNILRGPAEIALGIFHSIYPERLYTLLLHFHILYVIKEMTSEEQDEFLKICIEHKMRKAAILTLSLTEIIQEMCFGESPKKLTAIRESFGKKKQIELDRIPYLYSMGMVLNSFWGKKNDLIFATSMIRQVISMLNPSYGRYVMSVYKDRKDRDTY